MYAFSKKILGNKTPLGDISNRVASFPIKKKEDSHPVSFEKKKQHGASNLLADIIAKSAKKGKTVGALLAGKLKNNQSFLLDDAVAGTNKHTVTLALYHTIFGDNALAAIDLMKSKKSSLSVASVIHLLELLSKEWKAQLVIHMIENLCKNNYFLKFHFPQVENKFLEYAERKKICTTDHDNFEGENYIKRKSQQEGSQDGGLPDSVWHEFVESCKVLDLYRMIKTGKKIDLVTLRKWLMNKPSRNIQAILAKAILSDPVFDFSREDEVIKTELIRVVRTEMWNPSVLGHSATSAAKGGGQFQLSIAKLWSQYSSLLGGVKDKQALLSTDILSCKLSGLDTALLPVSNVLGEIITTLHIYQLEEVKGATLSTKYPVEARLYNLLNPNRVTMVLSNGGFAADLFLLLPKSAVMTPSLYTITCNVESFESPQWQVTNGAEDSTNGYFMLVHRDVTHSDITSLEKVNIGKHLTSYERMQVEMTNSGPHLSATYSINWGGEKVKTVRVHDFNCGKAIENWLLSGSQEPDAINFITSKRITLGNCTSKDAELQNYLGLISVENIGLTLLDELCVKLQFICDEHVSWQLNMILSMLTKSVHVHAAVIKKLIHVLEGRMQGIYQIARESLTLAEAKAPGRLEVTYLEYIPTPKDSDTAAPEPSLAVNI